MLLYLYAVRCSYTWRFPYDCGPTPSLCGTTTTTNIGPTPPAAISLLTPASQHTLPTSLLHTPSGETLADREEYRRPRRALLAPVPRRVCTLSGVSGGTQWDRPTAEAAQRPYVAGRGIHPVRAGQAAGLAPLGCVLRAWRVGLAGGLQAGVAGPGSTEDFDLWAFRSRDITPGSVGLHLLTRELV